MYTGVKKFRIQTLRVCRGDKTKPFCYVTNIWQVFRFLARGPWRVWHRMVLQKLLENVRKLHYLYSWHITGNVGECPATSRATIMVPAWRGPSTLCPWCQRIPEQCFPQSLDWEWWSSIVATTSSRSHSYGFLYLGEMKCLMFETPIDTPEELVARVAEAAAIIRERQSFARRYRLCINVNRWHFQQLL